MDSLLLRETDNKQIDKELQDDLMVASALGDKNNEE